MGTQRIDNPARTPEVIPGLDVRQLPIGPEEAFVLSRIDGRSCEEEIILATGLPPERVRSAFDRLERLGAVRFSVTAAPCETEPSLRGNQRGVGFHGFGGSAQSHGRAGSGLAVSDAEALGEDIDLELDRRRAILELHARLEQLNHYEVLGAAPSADRQAIKTAYYRAVALFHPDRYFGKRLGSFKSKLERVFQRMTEAHDVLTRSLSRAEYDEYLVALDRNRAYEQTLNTSPPPSLLAEPAWPHVAAGPVPDFGSSLPQHPLAAASSAGEPSAASDETDPLLSGAPRTSTPEPGSAPGPESLRRLPARSSDPAVRRRALARRLGGISIPPGRTTPVPLPDSAEQSEQKGVAGSAANLLTSPPPSAELTSLRVKAAEDLRRQHAQRLAAAQQAQLHRYLAAAEHAIAANNPVAAATALRIAASMAPGDSELADRLDQAESQAAAAQASSYLAQAEYEERHAKYGEAARAYERASVGQPSARIHERVAYCLLEVQGDPRKAVEHARRAVGLTPTEASYRLTLARAYLVAGMRQSGMNELVRARALAPEDATIAEWIRRAEKRQI
ncbi:DnaJ domain-containing protein [Myxococcota bacterium]